MSFGQGDVAQNGWIPQHVNHFPRYYVRHPKWGGPNLVGLLSRDGPGVSHSEGAAEEGTSVESARGRTSVHMGALPTGKGPTTETSPWCWAKGTL